MLDLETNAAALEQAQEEVTMWGIQQNYTFAHYDEDLEHRDGLMNR